MEFRRAISSGVSGGVLLTLVGCVTEPTTEPDDSDDVTERVEPQVDRKDVPTAKRQPVEPPRIIVRPQDGNRLFDSQNNASG